MKVRQYPHIEMGERIKSVRSHLKFLQKEFAETLGVSAPALSEVEKGKFKPSIELLMGLVENYEVNLYYILFNEPPMFIAPTHRSSLVSPRFSVKLEDVREFIKTFEQSDILQYRVMELFKTMKRKEKEKLKID